MQKNLFIALEGIDGSGKSTQVSYLRSFLEDQQHQVHTTFEPTSHPVGALIRKIFSHEVEADQHTIAALFVADRMEHLLHPENGMIALLKQGYSVITDRYYFSSYAYHSVHVPMDWVIDINRKCTELLRPDLTIFIDVPPDISMERIGKGRTQTEMYETKENLIRVREAYLEAFDRLKNEEVIAMVDGQHSAEAVAVAIQKELKSRFDL